MSDLRTPPDVSANLPATTLLALECDRANICHRRNISATNWEDGFTNAGTISGYVMAGTVTLLVSWWLFNNWGWWRLRVPGRRPQYIKTPRGWVKREKWDRKREKNRARRQARNARGEENFDWIFWDPEGAKKKEFDKQRQKGLIKFLPDFLRIFDPWAINEGRGSPHLSHDVGDRDVERGDIALRELRKPRLGDRWISFSTPKLNEHQQPCSSTVSESGSEQNPLKHEGNPGCHGKPSWHPGRDSTHIEIDVFEDSSLPTYKESSTCKPAIPEKAMQRSASLSLPRTVRADNARQRLATRSDPTNNTYYGYEPWH